MTELTPGIVFDDGRLVFAIVFEYERSVPYFLSSAPTHAANCALHDWLESQPALQALINEAARLELDEGSP